jgi:hypothetical protein
MLSLSLYVMSVKRERDIVSEKNTLSVARRLALRRGGNSAIVSGNVRAVSVFERRLEGGGDVSMVSITLLA